MQNRATRFCRKLDQMNDPVDYILVFSNRYDRFHQTFQAKRLPIQKSLRDEHTTLVFVIFMMIGISYTILIVSSLLENPGLFIC